MRSSDELKQLVKDKYNAIANGGDNCCGELSYSAIGESYKDVEGHVEDADLNLGCGLPVQHAGIKPGDTVVDLGSGAGNDAFVARAETGESGQVIGVDMAESMYAKAMANAAKLGFENVHFVLGEIEHTPLDNATADVVVSNCVFNLIPDKKAAFAETYRILKPGGHFSISDIVTRGEMPEDLRQKAELYAGCVSGAIEKEDYLAMIKEAGFESIHIMKEREIELPADITSAEERARMEEEGIGIYSITVNGTRPIAK